MMVCRLRFISAVEPLIDGANKHLPAVAANSGFRVNNVVASTIAMLATRFQKTLMTLGRPTWVFPYQCLRLGIVVSPSSRDHFQTG